MVIKDKTAQMKIQQMMFMLMAVTLLFILVGIFFLSIRLSKVRETAEILEQENSMLLVSKLANSPEFSCGNSFGNKVNCVDFDKIMALKEMGDYSDFWGVAKIEIRKIYPDESTICTNSNHPDCGIIKILDKDVDVLPFSSNFVSLCRKETNGNIIYNKCELALLMVASEDKNAE